LQRFINCKLQTQEKKKNMSDQTTLEPTAKSSEVDETVCNQKNESDGLSPTNKTDFESLLITARDDPSPCNFVALAKAIADLNENLETSQKNEKAANEALQQCKIEMEKQSASSMCENAKEFSKCLEMMGYNVDAKFMETTEPAFISKASAKDVLERYSAPFKHLFTTISEIYQTGVMAENTLAQPTKVAASSDDIRSALNQRKRQRVDETPTLVNEPSGFVARMLKDTLSENT
jgi:hypothetical protein